MGLEKLKGRGRLVPTLATGLEYQVNYEIHFPILEREPLRRLTRNHMCSSNVLCGLPIITGFQMDLISSISMWAKSIK